jgi:hypothetical protein
MSYDITIAADDAFSRSVPLAALRDFVSRLPSVHPSGDRGFVLREGERLWMEIDLEAVSEEGDTLDDGATSPTVNCLRLHVPYPNLGEPPHPEYFTTAIAIAKHLGWPAIDDQTGQPLGRPDTKPRWKLW